MSQYVSARHSFNGRTRMDMEDYFDEMELENLYQWIDRIPLTRPKTDLAKDFSDGVLVAEMIKYYFPRMVDLHNYTPAHSLKQKMENWYLLNRRVLQKLDLDLSDNVIRALSNAKTKVVEKVLMMLRNQLDRAIDRTTTWKLRARHLQDGLTKATSPYPLSSKMKFTNQALVPYPSKAFIPHSHPNRTGKSLWSWKPGPG